MSNFTAKPEHTYALVVGIEKYQAGWNINGPVNDALKFADWLLFRGVPKDNIRLCLSHLQENHQLVDNYELKIKTATSSSIYDILTNDLSKQQGDLLFIYWIGHGLIDSERDRRLICADATTNNWLNLSLDSLLNYLRSNLFNIRHHICIFDACANYILECDGRPTNLKSTEFSSGQPRKGSRQFVLLASRDGETAKVDSIEKTGYFSQAVRETLEEDKEWPPNVLAVADTVKHKVESLNKQQTPIYFYHQSWDGDIYESYLGSITNSEWVTTHLQNIENKYVDSMQLREQLTIEQAKQRYVDLLVQERIESYELKLTNFKPRQGLLSDFITNNNILLVLGEGGSGKTTSLLKLAFDAATSIKEGSNSPIPFYIKLSFFDTSENGFERLLEIASYDSNLTKEEIRKLLLQEQRPLLFLLDGFNEVGQSFQESCTLALKEFIQKKPHRYVITSRPSINSEGLAKKLKIIKLNILKLDNAQIKEFLERYDVVELYEQIEEQLKGLVRNPFMLWAFIQSYTGFSKGELISNKGQLYRNFIEKYIFGEREQSKVSPPTKYKYKQVKEQILAQLAYQTTIINQSETQITINDELLNKLKQWLEAIEKNNKRLQQVMPDDWKVKDFLDEVLLNGILRQLENKLEYMHQSVQNYFTAVYLDVVGFDNIDFLKCLEQISWGNKYDTWDEIIIFLAGITSNLDPLVEKMINKDCFLAAHCAGIQPDKLSSNVKNHLIEVVSKFNIQDTSIKFYSFLWEKIIDGCEQTLKLVQEKSHKWANLQVKLGVAYTERISGNWKENIDKAIGHCENALQIYLFKEFPQEHARTLVNLGNAYTQRIKGDKADNLEKAITNYQDALIIYTKDTFSSEWAQIQNNLGNAYHERIKGDRVNNLENAIAAYNAALTVRTQDNFSYEWAETQTGLGNVYSNRTLGNKADNLEKAIIAYQAALNVYTQNTLPYDWAMTQAGLGNAYLNRIKGDKADNLEKAITAYQSALNVYTQDNLPRRWAMIQAGLGNAYLNRIFGDKADNLEKAISAYEFALTVYSPTALPINCLRTASNLGNLLLDLERWQEAINAYDKAIQALELIRSWAIYESRRQQIIENDISIYDKIVQACINSEQLALAVEYAERSKARNLVEIIASRDIRPKGNIPQEIINKFDSLRKEIQAEKTSLSRQIQLQIQDTNFDEKQRQEENDKWKGTHQNIENLQQQLEELIKNKIQPLDPSFSLNQNIESINFTEIKSLLDERTAIIEWYITTDKIVAFIISLSLESSEKITFWQSQPEDLDILLDWKNEYLKDYDSSLKRKQWRNELEERLKKLAGILHIDKILELIPQNCDRLILIPHRFLHIFPLHALEVKSDNNSVNQCLLDLFSGGVKYAPSCQLLQLVQKKQSNDFTSLFAIQEPKNSLIQIPFGNLEVQVIRSFFSEPDVLNGERATLSALMNSKTRKSAHCIHFSCHTKFNVEQPLESAIFLADNDSLTLGNLFEGNFNLNQCHLVVLSAAETALIDANNNLSDECVGLTSGFLFAGSSSIVSSQWTLDDLATSFLIVKFYSNLTKSPQIGEGTVAAALKDAQVWLRDLNSEEAEKFFLKEIISYIDEIFPDRPRTAKSLKEGTLGRIKKDAYPFANPAYWAAFIATGF